MIDRPGWCQFSLRTLFVAVIFIAIGCAALVYASDLWLLSFSTLMIGLVMAAAVIGMFGQGTGRVFAVGFLMCSVAYLALVYLVLERENYGIGRIATTRILKQLHELRTDKATSPGAPVSVAIGQYHTFMQIGQLIWSIVIGAIGGLAATTVARRSRGAAHAQMCNASKCNKEEGQHEHVR